MEEVNSQIPSNDGENKVLRDEKGRMMPGSVLNPKGKPLGTKHLSTQLAEMLFEIAEEEGVPRRTLLNKTILKKAIKDGDMRAIELIYDRIEGKPDQKKDVNVTGSLSLSKLFGAAEGEDQSEDE